MDQLVGAAHTKSQTFDPFDRTTTQTTAITGKPTRNLRFTYLGTSDQVAVEEEKNNLGAWEVAKTYAHGPDGENLELKHTPVNETTDKTQYYGTNPHGDVETLTSADGTTASTYRYTAYGRPDKKGTTGEDAFATDGTEADRLEADTKVVNPYRFSGKRIHGGTGTYDIGFRDYNPGINRYLTRDHYNGALADLSRGSDPWGANRYAYAGGNPIGLVDLDGHRPIDISGNERPDLDARVTQKPAGVANDESPYVGGDEAPDAAPEAPPGSCAGSQSVAPGCMSWRNDVGPATPEDRRFAGELGLAGCSWVPILGWGCDTYDAKRTYEENGLLSWQMAAAGVGFIPLGDLAKLPKQAGNIGSAYKAADAAAKALPELPKALSGGRADTYVYYGTRDGKYVYTGITKNPDRRAAQHGERFDYLDQITDAPVTRGQARAIEQALIVRNPGFENKINSISPKHTYYNDAINWGEAWLRQNGY